MKKSDLLLFMIAGGAFFLTGCIAGTQVNTGPTPGEPVANFPKICAGDRWVGIGYSSSIGTDIWTEIVEETNKDGSFITIETSEKGKQKYKNNYNQNYNLFRSINLVKNTEVDLNTPPAKRLDFPLFVGKRWSDSYEGKSIDGKTYKYKNMYTVTDYQKIKLKTGETDVFRIWRAHENTHHATNMAAKEIYYYSPEIKAVIKTEPSWREGYELTDYSISNCE